MRPFGLPAAAAVMLLFISLAAAAAALTPAERRGKRIYTEGTGRHKISAILPGPGISVPGQGFPCINCHLAEGTGQIEGGIRSADISWFNLTKAYTTVRPSGRAHPPYTEESLAAAITSGLDPAGNEIDRAHPRFEMEREDLDDVVAYIKAMEREPVPGVSDNAVRVGFLFPESGPLAEAGREVEGLLAGYFAETNARGGLHNRSLVLVPLRYDPSRTGGSLARARGAVENEAVFCFLASIGSGVEDETASFLAKSRVPVVVPLLSAPDTGYGTDRYTFHIFAGTRDQARVMADFAAERIKRPRNRVGIVFATDRNGAAGAAGAREQMEKHDLAPAAEFPFAPGTFSAPDAVSALRGAAVDAVFFFGGPDEALAFAVEAERGSWRPLFLAPATMVGDALQAAPPLFLETTFLATPLATPEPSSRRMEQFVRLGKGSGMGERHRTFQFLAFSGAILLEEGLRRAGRGVTRERFVDAIGNVWELETGVTPPLTYNPNRRAGARGAAILKVDPSSRRYVPETRWRDPR